MTIYQKSRFAGHLVPGFCFISMALWWTYAIYRNYYQCKQQKTRFRSNTSFQAQRFKKLPIESLVKLTIVAIGVGGEVIPELDLRKMHLPINEGHHATMYAFFGLEAALEVLRFYRWRTVLPNVTYFAYFLAFLMQGLLFNYHLHGRAELDILLHRLLILTIFACSASVLFEMFFRDKVMVALCRPFFVLVQGTWFCHAGGILEPKYWWMPKWDEDDHGQMMLVTIYYVWHCVLDFSIILVIGHFVSLRYRSSSNVISINAGSIDKREVAFEYFALQEDSDDDYS